MQRIKHPQTLGDRFASPDTSDLSLVVLFDGWPHDLLRLHRSVTDAIRARTWEVVVVDNPGDDEASQAIAALPAVEHVPLRDKVGYGAGRNLGLRLATGRYVCVIDTSVELTGDVIPRIEEHFGDPSIGLVGRWGVVTKDGFDFEETEGPQVDGVEGYFMAMRRADIGRVGMFDPKFRFYRNADLDFSYQVRASGLATVIDPTLPVVRHEHRLWENTPDRDELSRKNFFRFRNRWYQRELSS